MLDACSLPARSKITMAKYRVALTRQSRVTVSFERHEFQVIYVLDASRADLHFVLPSIKGQIELGHSALIFCPNLFLCFFHRNSTFFYHCRGRSCRYWIGEDSPPEFAGMGSEVELDHVPTAIVARGRLPPTPLICPDLFRQCRSSSPSLCVRHEGLLSPASLKSDVASMHVFRHGGGVGDKKLKQ